jgi:hypothetical protein
LNQTPPTDYNFYKDISAEDRAKLYQQMTQNQKSVPNMLASAAGGIGDAIARSYGGQNTNYQQGIMANQEAQKQGALGAMDTQRQQRMQDVQAKMAMQESDPKSPYSQGLRQFLGQITGKAVPSGMSAGMIKGLFPDYVKVFEAKTQAATAAGAQGVDAGKALMGETLWDKFKESIGLAGPATGEAYLEKRIGGTSTPASNTAGWAIKKVQ